MADWLQLLRAFHQSTHADSGFEPVFGDPLIGSLGEIEKLIGLKIPAELAELYRRVDGYGLRPNGIDIEWTPWFLVPSSLLVEFVEGQRDLFVDSPSGIAERYLPFIDFGNGDLLGYLYGEAEDLLPGLHLFVHENFRDDKNQDPRDFFRTFDHSLAEFLST